MSASRLRAAAAAADSGQPDVIDEEHLRRATLDDGRLEQEVLQIFVRQSAILLDRISGRQSGAAAAAHTLKGSARSIGAWRVAQAAERLERAIGEAGTEQFDEAIAELRAATREARTTIAARLGETLAAP